MAGIARSRYISKRPRSLETWQSRSRFLFTRNTFSRFFFRYINKFNFRSVLFLTSIYTQKSLEIPIAVEIARIGKEMYHACRVYINPWGFSGSVVFIFFSFLSFGFLFDYWFPFFSSRNISIFRRMEFGSMREEGKKLARGEFRCVPKDIVFWLVELDEITRNHGSPTPFSTVRTMRI